MNFKKTALLAVMGLAMTGVAVSTAAADPQWDANHPRRDQVNDRLENQNRRIHQERREGEINGARARALHAQDHRIRMQERRMAARHGGHITRSEQRKLNRELNHTSREIGH
jgi:hypothetical protein